MNGTAFLRGGAGEGGPPAIGGAIGGASSEASPYQERGDGRTVASSLWMRERERDRHGGLINKELSVVKNVGGHVSRELFKTSSIDR